MAMEGVRPKASSGAKSQGGRGRVTGTPNISQPDFQILNEKKNQDVCMLTPGSSSFLHPAPHPEVFQEELQAKLQARKQSLGALGGMNLETLEPTDLV